MNWSWIVALGFGLSLISVCAANDASPLMTLKFLPSPAVCNDGSPAAYYFRNGFGDGANRWVIHLQGGAWCYNSVTCNERVVSSFNLTSSTQYWPNSTQIAYGLFSTNPDTNPDFYNSNVAYVNYCSSDNWSGNTTTTISGKKWYFQGKSIISTLFNTLPIESASDILFSGCSAGGQGVVVNADFVKSIVEQRNPFANFASLADAGWLMNPIPANRSTDRSIQFQMELGYKLWKGVVNQLCAESYPGREWMCYVSPYTYPFITSKIMIQTEQYDTYQVTSNCCNPPFTPTQSEYVETLRLSFYSSLHMIKPGDGVFSAACFHHCSTEDTSFNTIKIGGYNLQQVLHNYYSSKNQPTQLLDTCNSFNCSVGCPAAPY